ANAKGFAFEYMTSGRAVVLGDLGPWACAGMTGGRVYVRHNAFGIDAGAIERRLGEGAKVELKALDAEGLLDVDDLLTNYAEELKATDQGEEAVRILELAANAPENFLMVVPHKVQADPSISTESGLPSLAGLPGEPVGDRAHVFEQAVEHRLGI